MKTSTILSIAAAAALLLPPLARADDDHGGRSRAPMPAAYVQECGSCHAPFPPALLSADSWRRQLGGLARHYGTDASLDAATLAPIATWLQAYAGTGRRVTPAPPEDRITRGAWFVREHDEVPAAAWKRPAIKSPANCGACHAGAAEGRYSEHEVRIPR